MGTNQQFSRGRIPCGPNSSWLRNRVLPLYSYRVMTAWNNFQTVRVPSPQPGVVRPRFSLTSDILSFRHCSRQYGYFGNDGFVPAQATQIFYGTVIHQVLDGCHRHYWGLAGHSQGTMPTDADVESYFGDVQNALRSHGVRPASPAVAAKAIRVLKIFNRVEGPTLYPLIRNTEFRLESERNQYVLRGVVDVLARNPNAPDDPAQMPRLPRRISPSIECGSTRRLTSSTKPPGLKMRIFD